MNGKANRDGLTDKRWSLGKVVGAAACSALLVASMSVLGGCSSKASNTDNASSSTASTTTASGSGSMTSNATATQNTSETKELNIVESGYEVASSGYIKYAVCIENQNKEAGATYSTIAITGKDASGAILFSDKQTVSKIWPGQKGYFAGQAGSYGGAEPATVEFSVKTDSNNWKKMDAYPTDIYKIENCNYVDSKYMGKFMGTVTLTQDKSDFKKPMVVAVLRDDSGKIIGGYNTNIYDELPANSPQTFEVDVFDPPAFASYEIYVSPWS